MQQRPIVMNKANMIGATERAKSRVKAWIDLAAEVQADARQAERLKRHECKACFYAGRFGGAAMTTRPCMSCGNAELYGSTDTDVLCATCAKTHALCKHCGGDLSIRVRRKEWPSPPAPRNGQ